MFRSSAARVCALAVEARGFFTKRAWPSAWMRHFRLCPSGRSSLSAILPCAFPHGLWYKPPITMGVGGTMPAPVHFKYQAFLSYAHADVRWAKWLHGQLEGFPSDRDLAGRETSRGIAPQPLS